VITAEDIVSLLWAANVNGSKAALHISDATHGVPTKKYLTETFADFYRAKLEEMGLGTWDTQWDCDDFAYQFFTMIRWAHYQTKKSMAEGIAVGVVYFTSGARAEDGTGGGHAINVAVVDDNGSRRLIFIEPQRAAKGQPCELELTQHEKDSIWYITF